MPFWGGGGPSFLYVFFLPFFLPLFFTAGFLFLSSIAFRVFFVLMKNIDSISPQTKIVNEESYGIRRLADFYSHAVVSLSNEIPASYLEGSRLRSHRT